MKDDKLNLCVHFEKERITCNVNFFLSHSEIKQLISFLILTLILIFNFFIRVGETPEENSMTLQVLGRLYTNPKDTNTIFFIYLFCVITFVMSQPFQTPNYLSLC